MGCGASKAAPVVSPTQAKKTAGGKPQQQKQKTANTTNDNFMAVPSIIVREPTKIVCLD